MLNEKKRLSPETLVVILLYFFSFFGGELIGFRLGSTVLSFYRVLLVFSFAFFITRKRFLRCDFLTSKYIIALIFWIILSIFQLLYARDFSLGVKYLLVVGSAVWLTVASDVYADTKEVIKLILAVLIVAILFFLGTCLVEIATGKYFIKVDDEIILRELNHHSSWINDIFVKLLHLPKTMASGEPFIYIHKPIGFLGNQNNVAFFCFIANFILFVSVVFFGAESKTRSEKRRAVCIRILIVAVILLNAFVGLASDSKIILLAFPVFYGCVAIMLLKKKPFLILFGVFAAIALIAVAFFVYRVATNVDSEYSRGATGYGSYNIRLNLWVNSFDTLFKKTFGMGTGLGQAEAYLGEYTNTMTKWWHTPIKNCHSFILELLLTGGIFTFGVMAVAFVYGLRKIIKARYSEKRLSDKLALTGTFAFAVSFIVASFGPSSCFQLDYMWAALALVCTIVRFYQRRQGENTALKVAALSRLGKQGFFSIFIMNTLSKVIAFCQSLIVVRLLTKTMYGLYAYVTNILSIVILFEGLGAAEGILQFCSENSDDPKKKNAYFYFGMALGVSINTLIAIAIVIVALTVPFEVEGAGTILLILCMQPFVQFLFDCLAMNLRANLENNKYAVVNMIKIILTLVFIVAGALLWQVKGIAWFTYGYMFISIAIAGYMNAKYFKQMKERATLTKTEKKLFFRQSFYTAVSYASSVLMQLLDLFVVGLFIARETVIADYKVASTIPTACAFISSALMIFCYPYLVRHRDDLPWMKKSLFKIVAFLSVVSLLFGALFIPPARAWITTIFGNEYESATPVFIILIGSFMISNIFKLLCANMLLVYRKAHINFILALCDSGLNIVLDIIFVVNFGSIGAAWATLIITALSSAVHTVFVVMVMKKHFSGKNKGSPEVGASEEGTEKIAEGERV